MINLLLPCDKSDFRKLNCQTAPEVRSHLDYWRCFFSITENLHSLRKYGLKSLPFPPNEYHLNSPTVIMVIVFITFSHAWNTNTKKKEYILYTVICMQETMCPADHESLQMSWKLTRIYVSSNSDYQSNHEFQPPACGYQAHLQYECGVTGAAHPLL